MIYYLIKYLHFINTINHNRTLFNLILTLKDKFMPKIYLFSFLSCILISSNLQAQENIFEDIMETDVIKEDYNPEEDAETATAQAKKLLKTRSQNLRRQNFPKIRQRSSKMQSGHPSSNPSEKAHARFAQSGKKTYLRFLLHLRGRTIHARGSPYVKNHAIHRKSCQDPENTWHPVHAFLCRSFATAKLMLRQCLYKTSLFP